MVGFGGVVTPPEGLHRAGVRGQPRPALPGEPQRVGQPVALAFGVVGAFDPEPQQTAGLRLGQVEAQQHHVVPGDRPHRQPAGLCLCPHPGSSPRSPVTHRSSRAACAASRTAWPSRPTASSSRGEFIGRSCGWPSAAIGRARLGVAAWSRSVCGSQGSKFRCRRRVIRPGSGRIPLGRVATQRAANGTSPPLTLVAQRVSRDRISTEQLLTWRLFGPRPASCWVE